MPSAGGRRMVALMAVAGVLPGVLRAEPQSAAGAPAGPPLGDSGDARGVIQRYCVGCHNDRAQTAGLTLDPAQLTGGSPSEIGRHAETWEKVVRRLRAASMPPLGVPRPDEATYRRVAGTLEAALDQAAAASRVPGSLPLLYRLTRTQYRHAIRDLLALSDLPQELDYSTLLPADNAASGFDNIADLLFVAPQSLERYLAAARKISQLAVGDPTMPTLVNIHRLSPEQPQDGQASGLPAGTRGGLSIRSHFPLDAAYEIDVELSGRGRGRYELEVTVDGTRVALTELGRNAGQSPLSFRVPIRAGVRDVAVTFVQESDALPEATLRPQMRSRGTQLAVASVTISGPHDPTGPGDTRSRRRIFVCRPTGPDSEAPCARQILSTLARRAYRRPVTEADLADLWPFYEEHAAETGFERGVQKAIERLLVSPQFLFRIEHAPAGVSPGETFPVSDLELASRLSFFLWGSIPDEELLDLAVQERLGDPAVLESQVRRMLADEKADSLVTDFAAQWLFLGDVALKEPDPLVFRHYDQTLRQAFQRETELFVGSVFREDRSVLELLDTDYTFLNERLADHYGIPHVIGSDFRRVSLPDGSVRGGLLGQGSILTLTSYSTRTSPVLRGKYVLDNLLASPPPPPPPDVPALDTEGDVPGTVQTIRESMERHRASPACASCHAQMDPIGFSLEHFDAIGRWRESDAGAPIDASGTFPGGRAFTGVEGLKAILLGDPDRFVSALAERLLMYAVGRNLQYYDAPAVRAIVHRAAADDYRFSSLVLGVVDSAPFRLRSASRGE